MREDLFNAIRTLPPQYPGVEEMPAELRYLLGCRNFQQFQITLRAILDPARFCLFCKRTLLQKPIVETKNWYLKDNDFPASHMRAMLLILPKEHITDLKRVNSNDWKEIGELVSAAHTHRPITTGGALVMRFGDPAFHSGSMPHLHMNLICPDGEEEYRVPLAKNPEQIQGNYLRLLGFLAELEKRGGFDGLRTYLT